MTHAALMRGAGELRSVPLLADTPDGFAYVPAASLLYASTPGIRERSGVAGRVAAFVLEAEPAATAPLTRLFGLRTLEAALEWNPDPGECPLTEDEIDAVRDGLRELTGPLLARIRVERTDASDVPRRGEPLRAFVVWADGKAWPPPPETAQGLAMALADALGVNLVETFLAFIQSDDVQRQRVLDIAGGTGFLAEVREELSESEGDTDEVDDAPPSLERTPAAGAAEGEDESPTPPTGGTRPASPRVPLIDFEQLTIDGDPILVFDDKSRRCSPHATRRRSDIVPLVTSRSRDVGEVREAAWRQVAESHADRGWFYVREPLPGVWMLNEPQHVCTWMVCGSERAVLLDTGLGVVPIRPVAERLADRPVDVVNTHYHFDHVGGNWEFDDIAVHSLAAPLIAQDVPDDVLRAYMEYARRQIQALPAYEELDGEYFWLLTSESRPRPFPASFDPQAWTIRGTQASSLLDDGDRIDLGDRTLTVVHAPGHSPDMIALLDERAGLLFAADAFNIGPIYCHFPDSDLHALATTAARLAELASDVRLIVTHHYGRVLAEPTLLAQYAHDLERIVSGDVSLSRGRDILGDRLLEARFEHYWVTVPDPSVPERSLTEST